MGELTYVMYNPRSGLLLFTSSFWFNHGFYSDTLFDGILYSNKSFTKWITFRKDYLANYNLYHSVVMNLSFTVLDFSGTQFIHTNAFLTQLNVLVSMLLNINSF